jgi:stearoyl-CoA desaturase (Delta-9 desaturase)
VQEQTHIVLAPIFGLLLPAYIASFWGDFYGGFFVSGFAARVLGEHGTFFINRYLINSNNSHEYNLFSCISFAHWIGDQTYSLDSTGRGSLILAILAGGEGNHNFHHEFPHDYRNGIEWYEWDPTKYLILLCVQLGLASDLVTASDQEIRKGNIFNPSPILS